MEYVLTILNSQRKKVCFKKVDIANVSDSALPDAVFDLYAVKVVNGEEVRETPPLYSGMTSGTDGFLKDNSGISLFELPIGKYHLVETTAPAGYILKVEAVVVTVTSSDVTYNEGSSISSDGDGKSYDPATKVYTLKISNSSGYELPSTGGIGTTIFYVVGGVLVLAALVILVTKKRMDRD